MVFAHPDSTRAGWLELIRAGDDASLGDALVRLAQLAERAHRDESGSAGGDESVTDGQRVHGSDPGRVAVSDHDTPDHTEVNR